MNIARMVSELNSPKGRISAVAFGEKDISRRTADKPQSDSTVETEIRDCLFKYLLPNLRRKAEKPHACDKESKLL